jgi:transposase
MAEATHRGRAELARFARGLQDDLSAITAGLTLAWSNDATEAQIHRLSCSSARAMGVPVSGSCSSTSCRPPRAACGFTAGCSH